MGHADEDDDGDCGGVFCESHTDIFVEYGRPTIGCGKGYCNEEGANAAEN